MDRVTAYGRRNVRQILSVTVVGALLAMLLINRLGSLTSGLSANELVSANMPVGWHGIFHQPLDLPLKLVRSLFFWLWPAHGQTLTRLPNAIFGALSIIEFGLLIRIWHGKRTAVMSALLFATGAWTLHVSRLATYDVQYLWIVPTLLLINAGLTRYGDRYSVWLLSAVALALLLFVPGAIWLVALEVFFLHGLLGKGWRHFSMPWQKGLLALIILAGLPLLAINLTRPGQLIQWLGLPGHLADPGLLAKHFLGVPVHLIIRGPQYADLWLGRTPILDIFTLAMGLIGIYFYSTHLSSGRSRLLASIMLAGWILVALAGPVSLSLLVPLMYVAAAAGIAYLLREWLSVFPLNPVARGTGIVLVSLLIAFASVYNLRAYFIAWPHDPVTRTAFHYHR